MSERASILIIEDDQNIADGLALNLRLEGYGSSVCNDGDRALEAIEAEQPDLVLLDITLPGRDGLEILRELRDRAAPVPVIVLSARQGEFDKVAALRLGADDYVTKPFGVAELLARIDAVLRRLEKIRQLAVAADAGASAAAGSGSGETGAATVTATLGFADVSIDIESREVLRDGERLAVTRLEFDLLRFFVTHPGKVFGRHQLLSRVWGLEHSGTPRTVDNFVGQLRQKFESDPNEPRHFMTVRGSGYRFDP